MPPLDSALSRRRFLGLTAGVGAAALLAGCGDDEEAAPRAGASSSKPMTIRTCVYAKNHASAPLYWQQFAPEGVTVEVTTVTSSAEVQQGLEAGRLDAGLMGVYNTLTADKAAITSKIVGMVARQGIGLVGRTGKVQSVADLKGKKIAVPPPGVQVLILTELLRREGLTLNKDVQGIPLGYADHPAALEKGDVDAYVGTEPLCTQSVVTGVGTRLTEVYTTPIGDFNTALWMSSKTLADPEKAKLVVSLQKQAAEFLTPGGKNDEARWKDLLVTQFGYDEKVYERVLENVGAEWRFDEKRQSQFEGAGKTLLEAGTIQAEPDYEAFYAKEYWDA